MEESEQLKIDLYQPKYHTEVLKLALDISFFYKDSLFGGTGGPPVFKITGSAMQLTV